VAFGFLIVAMVSALAAGVLGATRARAATAASPPAAAAHSASDEALILDQGPTAGADSASSAPERCDALRAEGLRVTLQDRDAESFCLVDEPNLDATYVQLLNVTDPATIAERKARTARALAAAGHDVCRVTLWWVRRDAVRERVPVTEQYASPIACPPRLVAPDPVAALWSDFAARTVADALADAAREHGVSATLPLSVYLFGAHDAYVRHVTSGQPAAETRARLAATEGVTARGTIEGTWIALDASRFSPAWPERAAFVIRHEVAHYVQTVVAGCACAYPVWFSEGFADATAVAALGPITTRHLAARAVERAGKSVPLRDLESYTSADAVASLYDRGYATVSYIAERWGPDAPSDLLRRNRGGDPAAFIRELTAMTGMSLDDLDRAVGRWLLSAAPEGPASGEMRTRFAAAYAEYDPAAGRVEGEGSSFGPADAQVDVVASWDCAAGAHRVVTRWYRPDGTLHFEEAAGGADVRCALVTRSRLSLTPAVLSAAGRWRVEVIADGRTALTMALDIRGA
jgi:hypothetical protein